MSSKQRLDLFFRFLVILLGIFVLRLFYVQVITYSKYSNAASHQQYEALTIPASRGIIEARQGNAIVPIVLNQRLYTLFGDPSIIKNTNMVAQKITSVIGGQPSYYQHLLSYKNLQYIVLGRKLTQSQSKKIISFNLPGLGTRGQYYRTYPDGNLAAQVLGFVNSKGQGEYGIEQALNKTLSGKPGFLKAYTDVNGVPLVAMPGNINVNPVPGKNVVLTLHTTMETEAEKILKAGLIKARSKSGSIVVMNVHTGAIDVMANYPSYNPAHYSQVSSPSIYLNNTVATPLEVGSIQKTLTTSAALNVGAITANETFFDPARWPIDGAVITDIPQDGGPQQRTITSILVDSLNTGATWMLMQMGGGKIDSQARNIWHDYMVNHFHLGSPTGIQQGYEAGGYVPPPNHDGAGINLTYANTAFGQAVTSTPLQMAAGLASVLNGGTYYTPNLVQGIIGANGHEKINPPKIWKKNVVKPTIAPQLEKMMEAVINSNYWFYQMPRTPAGYMIGGKTGTAQIAKPNGGGYYANKFNGTFLGFVGGASPKYVVMVEVNSPNIPNNSIDTYAGAGAAAPIWGQVVHMLINTGHVNPAN